VIPTGSNGHAAEVTQGGWFVRIEHRPLATSRLYAFPHGGAGPGAFAALAAALPPQIEPWALHLPGRQARRDEPPRTDLAPLVAEIAADLTATTGGYALFGYCGGALLAYLAARQSRPQHLFVASFAAPDVAIVPRRLHLLPGELFWDAVLEQGGVPPELAAHAELRPVFEPAIRADFALYAEHRRRAFTPLDVPITVLYGRDDADLNLGGLLGWRRHTTAARPQLRGFPAGHWLIDEHPSGVAATLAEGVGVGAAPVPDEATGHVR
jgi:surfactin synthase thioesterase subunit